MGIGRKRSWSRQKILKLKRIVSSVVKKASSDNVFLLSSSVAFHCFLSFIPIIFVIVGIYLFLNFKLDWNHFQLAKEFVPPDVFRLIEGQAQRANHNMNTISLTTIFAFLLSLWLSNNVTRAFGQSLNIVFARGASGRVLYSLGASVLHTLMILGSVLFLSFTLSVVPIAFSAFKLPIEVRSLLVFAQWCVIFIYMIFALCFVYKLLPNHGRNIPWTKFLPGAFVATLLGSVLALLFSTYVSAFASFSRLYGALGVIIVFMLWLRLTFSCILFGGEVNYFFLKDPSLIRRIFFLRSVY